MKTPWPRIRISVSGNWRLSQNTVAEHMSLCLLSTHWRQTCLSTYNIITWKYVFMSLHFKRPSSRKLPVHYKMKVSVGALMFILMAFLICFFENWFDSFFFVLRMKLWNETLVYKGYNLHLSTVYFILSARPTNCVTFMPSRIEMKGKKWRAEWTRLWKARNVLVLWRRKV